VAFTFVNAARVLLTQVDSAFRSCSLTLVNEPLTVVNKAVGMNGDQE